MNKTPSSYWDTLKKNSTTKHDDDCILPNYIYSSSMKNNSRGDAKPIVEHENIIKTKRTNKDKPYSNSKPNVLDNFNLDAEYIEGLVTQVKELKNRMTYFESQQLNSKDFDYQNEVTELPKLRTPHDLPSADILYENRHKTSSENKSRNRSPLRNFEHQRSIYTTNEQNIVDFGATVIKDNLSKNSKTQLQNISVMMPVHLNKKKCEHNKMDSLEFKNAAEEFIQQAEDLKSKIAYILDCCCYEIPSAFSNASTSCVQSEYSNSLVSKNSHSRKSISKHSTKKSSKVNFTDAIKSINGQYAEILKTLSSIDQTMKKFGSNDDINNAKFKNKMQKESAIFTEIIPKQKSSLNLELKGCKKKQLDSFKNKKQSNSRSYSSKRNKYNDKIGNNLEPVVMVYEPIEPYQIKDTSGSAPFQKENKKKNSKHKNSKKDKSQKHGFMVTYTPDLKDTKINSSSSLTSANSKKSDQVKCCLNFKN